MKFVLGQLDLEERRCCLDRSRVNLTLIPIEADLE